MHFIQKLKDQFKSYKAITVLKYNFRTIFIIYRVKTKHFNN